MAGDDLKLDISYSNARGAFPYIAAAFAVLGILGIIIVSTTNVAARILPMDEKYTYWLVPTMSDGSPPLSVETLTQKTDGQAISVEGTVKNRSTSKITGLMAFIEVKDKYTLPLPGVNVPVDPRELEAGVSGKFQVTIPFGDKGLSAYVIQFKVGEDGPFVPHSDNRPTPPVLLKKNP